MMKKTLVMYTIIFTALTLSACGGSSDNLSPVLAVSVDGSTDINSSSLTVNLYSIEPSDLSAAEENSLAFMREEEKLARDVYNALYSIYGTNIFSNIGASEQTHTDAVLSLIERYSLIDPMLVDTFGEFENIDLQFIYDNLVESGSVSLLDAFYVGATVEELDIYDLQNQLNTDIDNEDITFVYQNLLKGSRNHLHSFDKQIKKNGGIYNPIYITQELYDSIINSSMETN